MTQDAAVRIRNVSKVFRIGMREEAPDSLAAAMLQALRNPVQNYRKYRSLYRFGDLKIGEPQRDVIWALADVSFDVPQGQVLGIVGHNGAGKSTLLKILTRITPPTHGEVQIRGRVSSLLEVGTGFHRELTGRENVYLNGTVLGMTKQEIDRKFDEIVEFSAVERFLDTPVKRYSSGMAVRLAFAVAAHLEPEILIIDEVLAVGDAAFQTKCGEKFAEFRREGRTVVVVSHSMPQLRNMSDQAAWLEHGQLKEVGSANVVLEKYLDSTRSDIRVSEDGRVRWGSGEAMVERVEVLDGNGAPFPDVVPTGSTVVLRLHYDARQRIDDPVFGFAMEAQDGTYMWGNNTRDLGFPIDRIEGRGVIDLTIPAIPLAIGGFVVHGSVVDSTTEHVFDYVRDAARIYIGRGVPFESGGYITMGGTWSFPTAGSVRA